MCDDCCHKEISHGLIGRAAAAAKWIIPGTILVLIPKCPLCVAAYVALVTGIGLSVSTAASLRVSAIVLCVGALGYLVCRLGYRMLHIPRLK